MARILIVSDAWHPQTNGVVTTLANICVQAKSQNDTVTLIHPGTFGKKIVKSYPNLSIYHIPEYQILSYLDEEYDHVHIATPETCLGSHFVKTCNKYKLNYTTAYHTKFPEFLQANYFLPTMFGWAWINYVLKNSMNIITTTPSMVNELQQKIQNQKIIPWIRGVDHVKFQQKVDLDNVRKMCGHPIVITVGRISPEKSIEDFCKCQFGERQTKIVIGDGPDKDYLAKKYSDVIFVGYQKHEELIQWYQAADCFVFTSKKDTLGAVMLEAMACGTPVAAYPVTGPIDIIKNGVNGWTADDLEFAVKKCLDIDRNSVYNESLKFSWAESYVQFKNALTKKV